MHSVLEERGIREKCNGQIYLDDGLQLTRISQRVLNDHLADVLLVASALGAVGGREEDLAVADDPAPVARELDDGALRVEK